MRLTTLILITAIISIVCVGKGPNKSRADHDLVQTKVQKAPSTYIGVQAQIADESRSIWKTVVRHTVGKEPLLSVVFTDFNHGLVGGKGVLYRTEDGGKTWLSSGLAIPEGARVYDIFFVNRSLGWVVMQTFDGTMSIDNNNQFWLLVTRDGGKSWRLQLHEKDAVISQLSFADERNGWLVGMKGLSTSYVLQTTDQGHNWRDISSIVMKANGRPTDWINSIITNGKLDATILIGTGKFMRTIDGGDTWQRYAELPSEPSQTGIRHLGVIADNRLWVAGGADSFEGIWGMIAVRQFDNSWVRYGLDLFFSDAIFISDKQILACGFIPVDPSHSTKRDGVILYSQDEGRNWSIIYRTSEVEMIKKLFPIDSKHILAVGDDGLVVSLESTQ